MRELQRMRVLTLGAAAALLASLLAPTPADARPNRGSRDRPESADTKPSRMPDGPINIVISIGSQRLWVYDRRGLLETSIVSTGVAGFPTPTGVFAILDKEVTHYSNIYGGASMPYMQRLTMSGVALHSGMTTGRPASHGCIRLPFSFAPKLFKITTVGDNVIVARDRPAPQLIAHANLFQPLRTPAAPAVVKQDEPPKRQSSNEAVPMAPVNTHPGKLARADVPGTTTDVPSTLEAEAIATKTASPNNADPAAIQDTHTHAFDPFGGAETKSISRDGRATDRSAKASGHALDEDAGSGRSLAKVKAVPVKPLPAIEIAAAQAAPAAAAPAEALKPVEPVVSILAPAAQAPKPAESGAAPAAPVEAVPAPEPKPARAGPAPVEQASVTAEPAPAPTPTAAPARQALALATPPQAGPAEPSALPQLDAPPSVVAARLMAGAKDAALLAAEPRSTAPLRILVTRRTQRDRIIGVQRIFADMGYLEQQEFDGTLGKATVGAIKAFQKANGMPETGALNEELAKKVYEVSGKGEPPAGHLYVRQEFGRVFDAPLTFKDPETPLGTHIYTALKFGPGDSSVRWTSMSLQGDDSVVALDRLDIPSDVRQKISERLTPGSSLIIGDTAINTAGLTKGNDFVVWAKETPAKITAASLDGDFTPAKPRKKKRVRAVRRPYFDYGYNPYQRPPGFSRGPAWPW